MQCEFVSNGCDAIGKSLITAIVLAGGAATRMGGVDKGLVLFHGKPLVESVLERIAEQVGNIVISANRNESRYQSYGHTVVTDRIQGFEGPLMGIASALEVTETPFAVVVPCDSPFVPEDYVERLTAAFCRDASLQCAAATAQGKKQPVFMMIRREVKKDIEQYLKDGNRRVRSWLEEKGVSWVEFEDLSAFDNLNTKEDLLAKSV